MPLIEVDAGTASKLEFAARIAGITTGKVVTRLVNQASLPDPPGAPPGKQTTTDASERASPRLDRHISGERRVPVFSIYEGVRSGGLYNPATHGVEITTGPLAGTQHKSPTGAARALVTHIKPSVSPHRNGWTFWVLDDGSGKDLQTIRD